MNAARWQLELLDLTRPIGEETAVRLLGDIVEGLAGRDRIEGQRVRFAALPLLLPGLTGCPVRAVAWIGR